MRQLNKQESNGFLNFVAEKMHSSREIGVLFALLVICLFFSLSAPNFLSTLNLLNVFRQVSVIGIITMAMTTLIISKEFDLSVGSTYAVVGILVALLYRNYEVSIWLASALGLIVAACLGLVNGILTVKGQIPSFIVTLGTMMVYRGLALLISGGQPQSVRLPASFFNLTGARLWAGIPAPVLWFVGITIVTWFLLHKSAYGFKVFATGGNAEAARLSGIKTDRVKITNFIFTGLTAGLAGIISMSYLSSATPTQGQGMELQVIAASVIGGTSLFGGAGTVIGAFMGALLMGVVRNGLVLMGTSAYLQELIVGMVLVAAVLLSSFSSRERS